MNLLDIFKPGENTDVTTGVDPTVILKKDHDKVRALFAAYKALAENQYQEKGRVFSDVNRELSIHARVEEEIFYPAVKVVDSEDAPAIVLEALEEHDIVKTLLAQLRALEPTGESFDAKMKVLMEGVEHHAEEEEDDMFPEARKLDRDTLHDLGNKMLVRKASLERAFENGKMEEAEESPSSTARPALKKAASAPSKRRSSGITTKSKTAKATGSKASSSKKSSES